MDVSVFVVIGIVGLVLLLGSLLVRRAARADMRSAGEPGGDDLLGSQATVVTRIPDNGYGEVTVVRSGQVLKLSARADGHVREGALVIVTSVLSSTSVIVAPASDTEDSPAGPAT